MRLGLPGLLLTAGGLLIASTAHAQTPYVPDGELAVVHVNGVANCSAFLVRPATFLTAKHCVQRSGETATLASVTLDVDRGGDGGSRATRAISSSKLWTTPGVWNDDFDIDGQDFAVIQVASPYAVDVPGVVPLRIYAGDPSTLVGEEVEQIGLGFHEGDYTRKRTTARIAAVGVTITVKPAVGCPGDSGGVLLLTKTREVIGIASREWPIGSDPCADPAKVTGYRVPESTYFQRIDTQLALIDAPPTPASDAPSSSGCSAAATDAGPWTIWGLAVGAVSLLLRKRRRAKESD